MRPGRTLGFGLLVLLIAAAAVYGAWWWHVARAVEDGVAAWSAQQRAHGVSVTYESLTVDGFPFAVRAVARQPSIDGGGIAWRGASLEAEAVPWDPRRIALTLPGIHHLRLADGGGVPLEVTAPQGGTGELFVSPAGLPVEVRLRFAGLTAAADGAVRAASIGALAVTLAQPPVPPAAHTDTGLSASVTVDAVRPPALNGHPLGPVIDRAFAEVRVQGRPPRPEPADLAAWSRAGGTVELDRLALDWGPLKVAANGTLALDRDLQPQAAMTAEVRGAREVLNTIRGTIGEAELRMAGLILGMLSRPAADTGESVLAAPLTIQDRALYVGPLKVAKVPVIRW
ncbi:DUF2125 domain-containing protein [Azospirillum halopraeferens]|uniref:DUF2125 domain-containing protein n=1 Tax=Azospirillum halopraeferens TaxID=34010 RepID=UPI0004126483|nr:DUF2125 domain-containing protein [Azospirillum halopraeferens]